MAVALRIDTVQISAQTGFLCTYTIGTPPLPVQPSGLGIAFGDKQQVKDWVLSLEQTWLEGDPTLIKLLIAMWHARDGNLNNTNLIEGRTITVDLAAASPGNVIKIQ